MPTAQKAFIADLKMEEGEEAYIPVRSSMLHQIKHFGIEVFLDSEQLEVLSVENGDIPEEYALSYFDQEQNGTSVHFSWFTLEPSGIDLSEGGVLFYIKVRAKNNVKSLKETVWQNLTNETNWLYANGNHEKMVFEVAVKHSNASLFSATLVGGNPVGNSLSVDITLPAPSMVEIKMIDSKGQVIHSMSQPCLAGNCNIPIFELPTTSGVYLIRVQTSDGVQTLRFVKI